MLSIFRHKIRGSITKIQVIMTLIIIGWVSTTSAAFAQQSAVDAVLGEAPKTLQVSEGTKNAIEGAVAKGFDNCNASNSSFGSIFIRMLDAPKPVMGLIILLFGIGGCIMVVRGLMGMRDLGGQPNSQNPLTTNIVRLTMGGLSLSLGFIINTVTATFGFGDRDSLASFQKSMVSCVMSGDASTKDAIIANFATDVSQPLIVVIYVFAAIIGLLMVGSALHQFPQTTTPSQGGPTVTGLLSRIAVGVLLINLYALSQSFTATVFTQEFSIGGAGCSPLSYSNHLDGSGAVQSLADCLSGTDVGIEKYAVGMQRVIYYALIPFGLIAFISGLMAINSAAQGRQSQNGGGYKGGAVRIIAGVMMINMSSFVCTAERTFSTGAVKNSYCVAVNN